MGNWSSSMKTRPSWSGIYFRAPREEGRPFCWAISTPEVVSLLPANMSHPASHNKPLLPPSPYPTSSRKILLSATKFPFRVFPPDARLRHWVACFGDHFHWLRDLWRRDPIHGFFGMRKCELSNLRRNNYGVVKFSFFTLFCKQYWNNLIWNSF